MEVTDDGHKVEAFFPDGVLSAEYGPEWSLPTRMRRLVRVGDPDGFGLYGQTEEVDGRLLCCMD